MRLRWGQPMVIVRGEVVGTVNLAVAVWLGACRRTRSSSNGVGAEGLHSSRNSGSMVRNAGNGDTPGRSNRSHGDLAVRASSGSNRSASCRRGRAEAVGGHRRGLAMARRFLGTTLVSLPTTCAIMDQGLLNSSDLSSSLSSSSTNGQRSRSGYQCVLLLRTALLLLPLPVRRSRILVFSRRGMLPGGYPRANVVTTTADGYEVSPAPASSPGGIVDADGYFHPDPVEVGGNGGAEECVESSGGPVEQPQEEAAAPARHVT